MTTTNNRPIYLQIADSLADDILAGRHGADERIPSVREVAAKMQVNANTVVRSYEQLERTGIIYNKRGLGYFVAEDAREKIISMRREEFYNSEMDYFFSRLRQIKMTPEELKELFCNYLTENIGR